MCLTEFDEEKFIRTVKAEGKVEGKVEGEINWQNRLKCLGDTLVLNGKADEIVRTVMEPDYAKKLMLMYGI